MDRYFFHSFPRPRSEESRDAQIAKGLKIARGLLENGILLTPENYEIPLVGADGSTYDTISAVQRRACFTELEPDALPGHAVTFGPFSLAYDIPDLRRLGASPVFYIPLQKSGDHMSGLATEMLGGFVDAQRIVTQLHAVQKLLINSPGLGLKYRENDVTFPPEAIQGIRLFVDVLADAAGCDLEATNAKLASLSSCFYPTENPKYTEPLHYYRQREWRLVGGSYTLNGHPVTTSATTEQVAALLEIDPVFFGKQLEFFESSKQIGAKVADSIANRSHYLKRIGDLDVVSLARFFITPDDVSLDSELLNAFSDRGINVVRQSDFCAVT